MKNKVLSIVDQICNTQATDCRSLNKLKLAMELLELAGVTNVKIVEIPLDWSRQVVIVLDRNGVTGELFAGVCEDGFIALEYGFEGDEEMTKVLQRD